MRVAPRVPPFAPDVQVLPGTALPAHKHSTFADVALGVCYTAWANLLDYSAGTVPVSVVLPGEDGVYEGTAHQDKWDRGALGCMRGSAGLPVAVQVMAPPHAEETVLRIMKEVEARVDFRAKHVASAVPGLPTSRL